MVLSTTPTISTGTLLLLILLISLQSARTVSYKTTPKKRGILCAVERAHLCARCLPANKYLACQGAILTSTPFHRGTTQKVRSILHLPHWAESNPIAYTAFIKVHPVHRAICAGFLTLLLRGRPCTVPPTRARLQTIAFAAAAARDLRPRGGLVFVDGGKIDWMPPPEKAGRKGTGTEGETVMRMASDLVHEDRYNVLGMPDRYRRSVRAADSMVESEKPAVRNATPSDRERFTSNINFRNPRSVQEQWQAILSGRFQKACPSSSVRVTRHGRGWQTSVTC